MKTLRIDAYIGKDDGMSFLFGGAPNFSLQSLNNFLDELPATETEIKVEINSGGGSVTEGFAIHDRLVSSGKTIYTEVLGMCGSIATIIALSAKPENRSMHENSEYFIHNPFWQPMAPEAMEADDLQQLADDLKNSEQRILDFYVNKTEGKRGELKGLMVEATSLSAKEAKKLGFVSRIIGEAVSEKRYKLVAFVDSTKKSKSTDMDFNDKQKSWLEEKFNAINSKFNSLFKPVFMAMVDLESGGKIFVDGEVVPGSKAFNVDAEGKQTTEMLADGDYVTKDGKTLAVKNGAIEAVKEKTEAPSEIDALKAKVTELEGQLKASNEAKAQAEAAVTTEKEKFNTELVALKTEVDKFKNMAIGNDVPPTGQHFKGDVNVKKTQAQMLKEYQDSKTK